MTELEKRAMPVIAVIAVLGLVMSIVMPGKSFEHHWYGREDGLLESATALALLAAALVCGYRCWILRHCRPRLFLLSTAAAGVILFFGMGEEISWGQRIFGIESPEFFQENNAQNETNLHNMVVAGTSINKLVFGKLLAAAVVLYLMLPLFYQRSKSIRRLLNQWAVPVPRVHHVILIAALVTLVETAGGVRYGEITEFAISSLGLLVLINPKNASIYCATAESTTLGRSSENVPEVHLLTAAEAASAAILAAEPLRRAA
jgi:hypothetical protein